MSAELRVREVPGKSSSTAFSTRESESAGQADDQPYEGEAIGDAPGAEAQDRVLTESQASVLVESLSRPLTVRSIALTVLTILASLYALRVARDFLLPIAVAMMLKFLLSPFVRWLTKLRIAPPIGAALVLLGFCGAVGYGGYVLTDPARDWLQELPHSVREASWKLRDFKNSFNRVTSAAKQIEELTTVEQGETAEDNAGGAEFVVQTKPAPATNNSLVGSAWRAVSAAIVTIILLYLLLASYDSFLRKLVVMLPRLREKKIAVEIVRSVERQISVYVLTVALINLALGAAVALALHFAGMPNPMLWGVLVALLNFIPYVGGLIGVVVIGLAAMLTFPTVGQALIPPLSYAALNGLEGMVITPLLLGRRFSLSPVAVFLWLLLWGSLWGVPGALIAMPMLVGLRILCENIRPLAPLGEFLAR